MHDKLSLDLLEVTFFENSWREFKAYLESKGTYTDATVHSRLRTVASFFGRNGTTLDLHKGDWEPTTKQKFITKFELSKEDIKRMYGHANLRSKCLLLILTQSGFSETDIQELKIEQIKGLYDLAINEHYYLMKPRDKTNHIQATCLSYEFLHDLKDLLAERGNPKEGFIFTSQTKGKDVENIGTRRINESMKDLAENTFGVDSEKAKAFKTKAFRSYYNACLGGVLDSNSELKDLFMGHSRGGARDNYSFFKETVVDAYTKIFDKYLSINGLQSREDNKKLREDMERKIGQITIDNMKTREESKKENEELREQLDEQGDRISEILGMISLVAKGKANISIESTKEGTQVSLRSNQENKEPIE
jgi:hypothetical protein